MYGKILEERSYWNFITQVVAHVSSNDDGCRFHSGLPLPSNGVPDDRSQRWGPRVCSVHDGEDGEKPSVRDREWAVHVRLAGLGREPRMDEGRVWGRLGQSSGSRDLRAPRTQECERRPSQ